MVSAKQGPTCLPVDEEWSTRTSDVLCLQLVAIHVGSKGQKLLLSGSHPFDLTSGQREE